MKLLSWLFGKIDATPVTLSRIWYPKEQPELFPELPETVRFQDHVLESLEHLPFSWVTNVHGVLLVLTSKQMDSEYLKQLRTGIWNDLLTKVSPLNIPVYIVYSPNIEEYYSRAEILEALGLARYQYSPLFVHHDLSKLDEFMETVYATNQVLDLSVVIEREENDEEE